MAHGVKKAAAIGGGVIGGGWVARFLLNGIDVAVYDPHPEAQRIMSEILANAERAYAKMLLPPLGAMGKLTFHDTVADAVKDADYIQESVPERLDIKHKVFAEIEAAAKKDALIGSSTSGYKPSELQEKAKNPERIFVAHPFNPVYLLPLVELVRTEKNDPKALDRAADFLTEVGMKPLHVRKEIDAHIADRFLEAVWREGLWLIKDGIATTEEIDDAIRFGFGLRWAQMGLFETYRVAGGEAGMRHFIAQFGPCLSWPWTKLMDVPELTDELVEMIATQSDEQSGKYTIRELERIRDDNLVGILQALKANDWGAGQSLKEMENRFYAKAHADSAKTKIEDGKPLQLYSTQVRGDWVDYNGHMTEFRYLQVLADGTDAFLIFIGMDENYRKRGLSIYTVETHIRHVQECKAGEKLTLYTRLLGKDEKRLRILHEVLNEAGDVVCTGEHMLLHVNTEEARACPMESPVTDRVETIARAHGGIGTPEFAGRPIRTI